MADSPEEDDLTWIPRVVRVKLDRAGVRIHLVDWQKLSLDARRALTACPCDTREEIAAFRARLAELFPHVE
jgi:hypothetical protein